MDQNQHNEASTGSLLAPLRADIDVKNVQVWNISTGAGMLSPPASGWNELIIRLPMRAVQFLCQNV